MASPVVLITTRFETCLEKFIMKKIIALMFIAMMLSGSAFADFSPEDMQNIELDGNLGATDC